MLLNSLFSYFLFLSSTINLYGLGITLDYHLYSQIFNELKRPDDSDTDLNGDHIVNYFQLNHYTIQTYNSYLYFPNNERLRLKTMAKHMFEFGYDNYMKYAFPNDELDTFILFFIYKVFKLILNIKKG